jgi:hypothetical protein
LPVAHGTRFAGLLTIRYKANSIKLLLFTRFTVLSFCRSTKKGCNEFLYKTAGVEKQPAKR